MKKRKKLKVIDLFAGIGGNRSGFERADKGKRLEFVYTNDFDKNCALTYGANFGEVDNRSITDVSVDEIPDFDILLAGFPCQAFSLAGKQKGFEDTRGTLFFDVQRIILNKIKKGKKPSAFLLENVGNLKHHDGGKTFSVMMNILRNELDYDVHEEILNSRFYGVPQNRPRIYIVGFKKKTDFKFPEKAKETKINSVLEKWGSVDPKYYISQKYYEGLIRHRNRHISKGNGFGYQILERDGVANTLVLGGMGRERNLVKDKPKMVYKSGLDKLKYKNKYGIRKLTISEFARLQGINDKTFKFPVSNTQAYRQIANSVSVPVIEKIAQEILKHL